MCIEFDSFRLQSYGHTMAQVVRLVGVPSIWERDLQALPTVRALAIAGRLDLLECLLDSAKMQAGRIGFAAAVPLLQGKRSELAALRAEVLAFQTPTADVQVLDADWGRKGRGAKITAWIEATGANAAAVAERFQLAQSSAQKYVRQAKRCLRLAA